MANPTSVGVSSYAPAIVEVTTTASSVTLDPNKQYLIVHNGVSTAGAANTDVIWLATGTSTAALTAGSGQAILTTGKSLVLGPGISTLGFDVGANAPTMTVVPIFNDFGGH